jgi:hypothetical protein
VNGKVVFNTEGILPGNVLSPQPQCDRGYLIGWVIDALFRPYLGTGTTLILSFVISTVAFFLARRWLNELRHG